MGDILKCYICKKEIKEAESIRPPALALKRSKYVCSPVTERDCAVVLSQELLAAKKEKAWKARKKAYRETKLSTRKRAAKEACHAYIRERDKFDTCICCVEPLGDDYHAGHWIESGNYPAVRYDEDNIHGQRLHCNVYKGGDSGDYERNLRAKIGDQRVDRLLSKKHEKVRYTADDYREIERYYKDKLQKLIEDRFND